MRVRFLAVAVVLASGARADGPPGAAETHPAASAPDAGAAAPAAAAAAPAPAGSATADGGVAPASTTPAPAPFPGTPAAAAAAAGAVAVPAAPAASATAAVAPPAPRVLPPLAPGLGRVTGRVTLAGLAPKLAALPVAKDMKACGTSKPDEALEVGLGGGVKNALLWAPTGPPPSKGSKARAKLALSACQFVPHLVAAPVGGELLVVNEDAVFHNATATGDLVFSYAMPIKGHTIPTKLKKAGVAKLESKSHPWMKAWVHVLPTTAFSVTEADGSYFLDLPPGAYALKLWHERLGDREDRIEIEAGKTSIRDLALTPR